jgi:hypothetical protein
MTVAASAILNRVRLQLADNQAGGLPYRWTDVELLGWLSDGQRTVVATQPRSSSKLVNVSLVAGTRQTLPSDAFQLLTCVRNMGASGTTPGKALQRVDRSLMDTQYPTWPQDTQTAAPYLWMYDLADPTAFHVYPPNNGTAKVEVLYAQLPTELVATSDLLTVDDIYLTPLFDYVMYRAHSKDSDYAGGQQLASVYLGSFTAFLSSLQKDEPTDLSMAGKT